MADNTLKVPKYISFDLTDRCQLRCVTCSKWKLDTNTRQFELTTHEVKDIILKLREWLGPHAILFAGGEPFLREDIFEIIEFAALNEVKPLVISNGYKIQQYINQLINSSIVSLTISINALTPEKHDKTRGIKGSFQEAFNAVKEINSLRKALNKPFKLHIASILMPDNYAECLPLLEWVKKEGLDGIAFQVQISNKALQPFINKEDTFNTGFQYDQQIVDDYIRTQKQGLELINFLIKRKEKGEPIKNTLQQLHAMKLFLEKPDKLPSLRCLIGHNNFYIDPYANVRICAMFNSLGSLKEKTPQTIWESEEAEQQRQEITQCNLLCKLLLCNLKI